MAKAWLGFMVKADYRSTKGPQPAHRKGKIGPIKGELFHVFIHIASFSLKPKAKD
jgi:hypothetical protein